MSLTFSASSNPNVKEEKSTNAPEIIITMVKTESGFGSHRFRAVKPALPAPQSTARLLRLKTSLLIPQGCCLVCFRIACPLRSHKQYAQSRGLKAPASATNNTHSPFDLIPSSSEVSVEVHENLQPGLVEICATKVDPFIDFLLPKGVTVEIHQLFHDSP